MSIEIDELTKTIMDCVMNSHIISDEGISYKEQHIPTKPPETDVQSARLYEKNREGENIKGGLGIQDSLRGKKMVFVIQVTCNYTSKSTQQGCTFGLCFIQIW